MLYILGFVFSFYHGKPPSNHHLRRHRLTFSGHPMQIQVYVERIYLISIHPFQICPSIKWPFKSSTLRIGARIWSQKTWRNVELCSWWPFRCISNICWMPRINRPRQLGWWTSWSTFFPHRVTVDVGSWMDSLQDLKFDVSFSALKRKTCPKVVVFTTLSIWQGLCVNFGGCTKFSTLLVLKLYLYENLSNDERNSFHVLWSVGMFLLGHVCVFWSRFYPRCTTVDGRNPAPPGCIKPYKWWDKLPINWCRISSINSSSTPFCKMPVMRLEISVHTRGPFLKNNCCHVVTHICCSSIWTSFQFLKFIP